MYKGCSPVFILSLHWQALKVIFYSFCGVYVQMKYKYAYVLSRMLPLFLHTWNIFVLAIWHDIWWIYSNKCKSYKKRNSFSNKKCTSSSKWWYIQLFSFFFFFFFVVFLVLFVCKHVLIPHEFITWLLLVMMSGCGSLEAAIRCVIYVCLIFFVVFYTWFVFSGKQQN